MSEHCNVVGEAPYGRGITHLIRFSSTWLLIFLAILWLNCGISTRGQAAEIFEDDAWLEETLRQAQTTHCISAQDTFHKAICSGQLRIGVRGDYPGFGTRTGADFVGYDVAVGRAIASHLHLKPVLVEVTPANRISKLRSHSVELIIATMAHTVTRGREIKFIRPHYYAAETMIWGPIETKAFAESDLSGRTMCTTFGHFYNTRLAQTRARVSMYTSGQRLYDAFKSHICTFAMQDANFFDWAMTHPGFGEQFNLKIRWEATPWGIGIPDETSGDFEAILSHLLAMMHASGELIDLAKQNGVPSPFLLDAQRLWRTRECWTREGAPSTDCMQPPFDDELIN